MSYPDPFEEKSPWDETSENTAPTKENAPMTEASAGPAPYKIGSTLKAASGYDAEWLTPTVWGHDPTETARMMKALLVAMKEEDLIETNAKAADYTRSQFKGSAGNPGGGSASKKFQGGKVQSKKPAVADDDCPHGRSLVEKANWAALFCNSQDESDKCDPLWRQKDGSFKAR